MRRRLTSSLSAAAGLVIVLWLIAPPLAGQSRTPAATPGATPRAAPRTAWGDPDLQGIWSYATITPLERPASQTGREFLTPEETAALNVDAAARGDQRSADPQADVAGAYNAFWWDRGGSTGRTSLIIDPPNGRLPPLTAEGERRRAEVAAYRRAHPYDSWEDRPLQERCIIYHGVPPLPTGYNNHYQIVQAPGLVAILDENIHDVRLIPLDGRPHLPPNVRQWNGDSRGRWEGDTLVVETTNYHQQTTFRFPTASETLRAVERFTRVAPDKIDYRYTIHDATTYTRPWTVDLPLNSIEGPIFEYACHEGNHSLPNVLAGARAEEKEAQETPPQAEFRTPWGHPDLQGMWTNSTITPLERPAAFAGREFLTEAEVRALDAAEAVRYDQRSSNRAADVDAAYNQFWWERGRTVATRRTSLIVDPPDGRIPALTPEGQKRVAAVAAALRGVPRGPEDRNLAERCLTRGAPKLPGGYNNNFQIVQTPAYVAILQEMVHEVRIIPLDGRPHLPPAIGLWLGDSRGRWEGDTLVVDTTNYHDLSMFNSYNCCRGAGGRLRIVERYRRIDADTIDHQFTVEDATTFTGPYTVAVPMTRIEGPIFEYACHEGNYGMEGILRGARAQEKESTAAQANVELPGSRQPRGLPALRVAPLPEAKWEDVHRQLVAKFARDGRADNGLRTLLHLPPLVEAVMPYTIYLSEQSSLAARHRHLLILRTAWLCGSEAIWSSAAARAQETTSTTSTTSTRSTGLTVAEIRRVAEGAGAPGWTSAEAALLRMADELYRLSSVSDATWRALSAGYDVHGLMDAVETVNHFTALALLYNSLGVRPDDGMADRLPADVPYRLFVNDREPPLAAARIEPVDGPGIAVGRTLARHPLLNQARSRRANFINQVSKLEPRHREMLILRIGWDTRSEYEWAQHVGSVGRARDHGLDPRRIAEGADAPGWDRFEQAILRAVDELYRDATVSDGTWQTLSERFDAGLLMSAVFTASSYRATSMALNAFGVQLEPGNERFPQLTAR